MNGQQKNQTVKKDYVVVVYLRHEDDHDKFGIVIEDSEIHRKRILDMIKEYEESFGKKFEL